MCPFSIAYINLIEIFFGSRKVRGCIVKNKGRVLEFYKSFVGLNREENAELGIQAFFWFLQFCDISLLF